ncbi:MAG: hypothetical protein ACI8PP_000541 [Candidatus Pseudothioglobus sp.]
MLAVVWGVGAFVALLTTAIWRLSPLALASLDYDWQSRHYFVFFINFVVMAWYEGYRGFQLQFSPRFAARAAALYKQATPRQALLSPLILMCFLQAPRRRLIVAYLLAAGIAMLVALYRTLPQPWRGILDAGVVVGIAWGIIATVWVTFNALRFGTVVDAELVNPKRARG